MVTIKPQWQTSYDNLLAQYDSARDQHFRARGAWDALGPRLQQAYIQQGRRPPPDEFTVPHPGSLEEFMRRNGLAQRTQPRSAPGGSPESIARNQYIADVPDLSRISIPGTSSLVTYSGGGPLQTYQGVGALPTYEGADPLPPWVAGEWEGTEEWQGFTEDDLVLDPGYQFRLSEGEKAIRRQSAAAGMTGSGATGKALQRWGQDLASEEFAAARARHRDDFMITQEQQRYDYEIRERDRARAHEYAIAAAVFDANEQRMMFESLIASKRFEADEARAIVNSANQARMYADNQRLLSVQSQNQAIRYRDEGAWRSFDARLAMTLGQHQLDQGAKDREYQIHRDIINDGKEMTSALAMIQGQVMSAQIQALVSAFEARGMGEIGAANAYMYA